MKSPWPFFLRLPFAVKAPAYAQRETACPADPLQLPSVTAATDSAGATVEGGAPLPAPPAVTEWPLAVSVAPTTNAEAVVQPPSAQTASTGSASKRPGRNENGQPSAADRRDADELGASW